MELFSLEEDDFGDLFLTQKDTNNVANQDINHEDDSEMFLGKSEQDFQSPCASLVCDRKESSAMYLDISDFEGNQEEPMEVNRR